MTITVNELSLQAINAALLRIQRSIQTGNNNFQNDVEKAVANVTITGKTTIQKYDDSRLMAIVNELNQKYNNLSEEQTSIRDKIISLETILANVALDYDPDTNELTYSLGDYSNSVILRDTTYTFSYDDETGAFTIVDDFTGETVFNETFNDTTYTFSFNDGILTVHNNLLDTDQTFNFDARYYTESEIQALILDKIPTEASSSNQLADKAFVNSSISTATATFRGTVTTTQALEALTGDLNDYAFLQNIDPTTGQTTSYDRYKWVESGGDYGHWKYEYTLNNSSFTSDQWAAINSGITCQIVTDLLDGCYSGNGSALCKSAGNEWRSLLSTNCNCTGSVNADYIYYNTNVQVNQCSGLLSANCYCVCGRGFLPYTMCSLTASSLGLTAGCCYSMTCILDKLRCCYGAKPGTYVFQYSNAANPIICETSGYAYCLSFTKLDSINVPAATWQRDRWIIEDHSNGARWNASAASADTVGYWTWSLNRNATACRIYRNVTCDNAAFPLLFAGSNTAGYGNVCVSCGYPITYNPGTGVLNITNGTCVGYNKTKSYCIRVEPADTSSCWIYIGSFQTNSTGDATNTYNELNLTIAAVGTGMVSSANIKILSANATAPTIIVQRQCGYSSSSGIDCVAVTCSGSTWNCYVCVWARVKSYGTCVYFVHLYRNMVPDTWSTALTLCSAITGGIVGVGNVDINTRAIQTNVPLRIGSLTACTSSVAGCAGSSYGSGWMEMYAGNPYIDFHVNHYCGDYSQRILACAGALCFRVTNATGCTECTEANTYLMCSNGNATIPGCIIHSGDWVERWCWGKPDNSGYPVYRLLYDITDWYNGTTGVAYKGIDGIITQARTGGYLSEGISTITAAVAWGRNGQADTCVISNVRTLTWACLGYVSNAVTPYILKCGSCYYLAIRAGGSGRPIFFTGRMSTPNSVLTTTVNTTDASGTLPTGWSIVSSPTNCFAATRAYAQDRCLTNTDATYHVALWNGNTAAASVYEYVAGDRPLTYNPATGMLGANRGFVAGTGDNAACPFICIDCSCSQRMIGLSRAPNIDVGLLLSHCADWSGTTYCTLGIEIGSGNVNRGFYHCKAGTFEWLQYWDASTERHACPQCFLCSIQGNSTATFAGAVSSSNTERWGSVYSSSNYNTGYYLIAQFNTAASGAVNHDITIGGKVDAHAGTITCKTWHFKAFMRGNKCTVSCASVYVDSDEAANWLCFTRDVDTATCTFTLRVYARIGGCWSRYNTTIDYLAGGDVGSRYGLNSGCLTFPNTYAANATAFVGTLISPKCSCGILTADGYKTNVLYRCCSFPANSTSYILLGCFNLTNDTNLDLGFSVGGSGIVGKGNIKALLTNGSCCLNCFCNNNIEVKYSNYINDLRGVSSIGFTTSGSSWDSRIGVWLEICNCSSSACCWSVSLFRNLISDAWSTCMTCQSTMPAFVCAIQVPACRRNFYYNNADAMINTWAYDGRYDSGSCKCQVFTFQICGVGELRAPTHQKIFLSTTGTGVSTPLNIWIEYMKGTCKDYIAACYSGGDSEVIVPMRISSDHDNSIYIDYAVCCDIARQFCTHIYDSGNMPAGSQGNSAIINDLSGCWLYDAAGGYNLERNTQVIFNVDCPDSQFVTNVITAQTIAACCVATTSDIRQKKDIKPYNNGLSLVKNLDIISFRYMGENKDDIEHISIPANWSCQLISGKGQNQLRVNDAVGILLSAVKDLGHSMTLWQRIRLWFYKKFVETKTNKVLEKKVKDFTNK